MSRVVKTSNPVTDGLIGLWVLDNTVAEDLVGSNDWTTTPLLTLNTAGDGVEWKAGNGNNTVTSNPGISFPASNGGAYSVLLEVTIHEAFIFEDPYVQFQGWRTSVSAPSTKFPLKLNSYNTNCRFGVVDGKQLTGGNALGTKRTLVLTCPNYTNANYCTFKSYLNGSPESTWTGTEAFVDASAPMQIMFIGRAGNATGKISYHSLAVWNRELTDAEVASIGSSPVSQLTINSSVVVPGTASFVFSGPDGIEIEATDASSGTAPYTYQWQRNEDGGSYSDLVDGSGVSGATTLSLTDGSAEEDILYGYQLVYTDDDSSTATSNTVTAKIYTGGAFGIRVSYFSY